VRAVDSEGLRAVGVQGVVVNTFHLMRGPGTRLIKEAGGVHRFMDWDGPVVSDSGGFQVYSLIRQNPGSGTIRPNEVIFREPSSGERLTLTPERCVQAQFQLGSDVVMCLDDCTSVADEPAEQSRSVERTVRWAKRCREEFDRLLAQSRPPRSATPRRGAGSRKADAEPAPRPLLFAVVQGGASEALRRQCAASLAEIGFDGYGFGGWPITPDGSLLTDLLQLVAEATPAGTPLHALGVGRPDHVVRAAALGYSIFDCSLPTRDARHRRLYSFLPQCDPSRPSVSFSPGEPFYETVYAYDQAHANDFGPLDPTCDCPLCRRHSRAYLRHLFRVEDATAERLATMHNLRFYVRLLDALRRSAAPHGGPPAPAAPGPLPSPPPPR
jgi:queuine tRNA-ribosyltransferase